MERGRHPRGLLRLLLRFPILLYRVGLGWLFGHRFLLMTHSGRKSGRPRRVVLEVVRHDQQTDAWIIASGWGEQSTWLRNVEKTPEVGVQAGLRKWAAVAMRLEPEQVERELLDYARRHPAAFRGLAKWHKIAASQAVAAEQACRMLSSQIPMLALQPRKR